MFAVRRGPGGDDLGGEVPIGQNGRGDRASIVLTVRNMEAGQAVEELEDRLRRRCPSRSASTPATCIDVAGQIQGRIAGAGVRRPGFADPGAGPCRSRRPIRLDAAEAVTWSSSRKARSACRGPMCSSPAPVALGPGSRLRGGRSDRDFASQECGPDTTSPRRGSFAGQIVRQSNGLFTEPTVRRPTVATDQSRSRSPAPPASIRLGNLDIFLSASRRRSPLKHLCGSWAVGARMRYAAAHTSSRPQLMLNRHDPASGRVLSATGGGR